MHELGYIETQTTERELLFKKWLKINTWNWFIFLLFTRSEHNIIEAASNGASLSISLIANIAVNLIAFIAILDFIDATLTWFGDRVGMKDPELTFSVRTIFVNHYFIGTNTLIDLERYCQLFHASQKGQ